MVLSISYRKSLLNDVLNAVLNGSSTNNEYPISLIKIAMLEYIVSS